MVRLSRFSWRDLKRKSEKDLAWSGRAASWLWRWRADQHKHVILCYIKSNIPWYSVSSPPHISLFCIIESVLDIWGRPYFSFRPLLKLSVLKSLLMKETIPTPKGQMWQTWWCSSAECCLFGLIRIVLKWLTPNSSCASCFSISHVYKCQKYFEPGVMKAWKHLLIESCFNIANTCM